MTRKPLAVLAALLMLAPASVTAEDAADATLTFDVDDAPTRVELTSDSVNADGRTKAPGDPVITRFRVEDDNGLDDVESLEVRHERQAPNGTWRLVDAEVLTELDGGDPSVTVADFEDRYGPTPLPEGAYRVVVRAVNHTGGVSEVNRTFEVIDTRPYLQAGTLSATSLVPDRAHDLDVHLVVADDNFGAAGGFDGPAAFDTLTLKVFRYTRTVDAPGWNLTLGDAQAEAGVLQLDLSNETPMNASWPVRDAGLVMNGTLTVPVGADAGDYRISVYHEADGNRNLLDTLPFEVRPVPKPTNVTAPEVVRTGESFAVEADVPEGATLRARLLDREGAPVAPAAWANASGPDARAVVHVPGNLSAGEYVLEAAALSGPDAEVVPADDGGYENAVLRAVAVENVPPEVNLSIVGPTLVAGDAPLVLNGTVQGIEHTRWTLSGPNGTVPDASARVTVRPGGGWNVTAGDLPPGTYNLTLTGEGHGGNASATVSFDVAAWAALGLPAPRADFGTGLATLPVDHRGNVPAVRLVAVAGPTVGPDDRAILEGAEVALVVDGVTRATALVEEGRAALTGDDELLAPGEAGELRVQGGLPPGLDAGHYELPLRLLVTPAGGAA